MQLMRVDPENCGCADCLVGYSKPIDHCSDGELIQLAYGYLQNASGCKVKTNVTYSYK
jgi:hypothetical protein